MACGSFEANPEMRARHIGPGWENVKIRGVLFNTGDGLNMAMEIGAHPHGSWSSCHASPQDANRPKYDVPGPGVSGEYWSRYAYPFGIMVNMEGRRFVDEGEDMAGAHIRQDRPCHTVATRRAGISSLRCRAQTAGFD